MIVLDTNVLSELMRPNPDRAVMQWISAQPSTSLFTTSLTQAEIFYGLALLPEGLRRNKLIEAAKAMFYTEFVDRLLPFDTDAAMAYAGIAAARRASGQPISQIDAQIAAICNSRGARLASRNIRDFVDCGVPLIDPWLG